MSKFGFIPVLLLIVSIGTGIAAYRIAMMRRCTVWVSRNATLDDSLAINAALSRTSCKKVTIKFK